MSSSCGRFIIVYNGEIYNHLEIRKHLAAENSSISWRGHSDTEVLLAAIQRWGFRGALERCVGMFAIALWIGKKAPSIWHATVVGKSLSIMAFCATHSFLHLN